MSAGLQTVTFYGEESGGGNHSAANPELTLIFVPTAYGVVDLDPVQ